MRVSFAAPGHFSVTFRLQANANVHGHLCHVSPNTLKIHHLQNLIFFFLLESHECPQSGGRQQTFSSVPLVTSVLFNLTSAPPREGRFRLFTFFSLMYFGHSVNTPAIHAGTLRLSSHTSWPGFEKGKLINCCRAIMS